MKRIFIIMEGGLVQQVVSNDDFSDTEVVIVDYDVNLGDPDNLTMIPQGMGNKDIPAYVNGMVIDSIYDPDLDTIVWRFTNNIHPSEDDL